MSKYGQMTMEYDSPFEPALNMKLMKKEADRSLVQHVMDVWKSLEVLSAIEITGWKFSNREHEIDMNKYISRRDRRKKKGEIYDVKLVDGSRCGLLTVYAKITLDEYDPKTGETVRKVQDVEKEMLIPIQNDDGTYTIKGRNFYLIYQLVDKSTYTSPSAVTLKSLMPVVVKREAVKAGIADAVDIFLENYDFEESGKPVIDHAGNLYSLPVYQVYVFTKPIPVILFYLKDGFRGAMDYLGLNGAIDLVEEVPESYDALAKNLYFEISAKCFIEVQKEAFEKFAFVRSVVGGLIYVSTNRCTIETFYDPDHWIKKIGGNIKLERGLSTLNYSKRLLDEGTKKTLKVHDYHKQDIYTILRWMCQEFQSLRLKDNLSLNNKRLRCAEVIASLLTMEFSLKVNRIIRAGKNATMEKYLDLFKFSGDILIQKMHSSGILRFDETVNDLTFFRAFKYTAKGPNSMGGKDGNNIAIKYRGIDPSHLGNLDILVCGNSDPGTSGLVSPFTTIDGMYFDPSDESGTFMMDFQNHMNETIRACNDGSSYIRIESDNPDTLYDAMLNLEKTARDCVKFYGTSFSDTPEVIIGVEAEGGETNGT